MTVCVCERERDSVCVREGVRKSVCEREEGVRECVREGGRPLLKHILHQWAGASGVAVAKTLYDGGITDFIILEASDRIGGRMRAVDFAGVKVEKGANWIQGLNRSYPESHPIWPRVQICGLDGVFTTFDGKHVHVYDNAGANIANSSLLRWDEGV